MKRFKSFWHFLRLVLFKNKEAEDGEEYEFSFTIPLIIIIGLFVLAYYWYETYKP